MKISQKQNGAMKSDQNRALIGLGRKLTCLLLLLSFNGLLSCKKEKVSSSQDEIVERTVLIYIAANNNLENDALNSINKMENAAKSLKGNLIVFVKTNSNNSYLLRIRYDNTNRIKSDTLKTYGNRNSSDPEFLKEVIRDSRALSPANSYSLVMWSHATSWAPPSGVKNESFGSDEEKEMDIKDFKNAIPSDFTYIMFDACSMGSSEVVYELKDKTSYILTSPSEVLSSSFPYDVITPSLFGDVEDLKDVSQKFIEYYASFPGLSASATVSLIDTRELNQLAVETKTLLSSYSTKVDFNVNTIQKLDFEANSGIPAYDFLSFLQQNFKSEQYEGIKTQLNKAVIFKGHTKNFFNVPIKTFCGLSIYLPNQNDHYKNYYSTLEWSKATGWNRFFD